MEAGPLNLMRPEVPAELAALVAKMMAKEPEQAVPDARRGRSGADAVLQGGAMSRRSCRSRRCPEPVSQRRNGPRVGRSRHRQPAADSGKPGVRAKKAAAPSIPRRPGGRASSTSRRPSRFHSRASVARPKPTLDPSVMARACGRRGTWRRFAGGRLFRLDRTDHGPFICQTDDPDNRGIVKRGGPQPISHAARQRDGIAVVRSRGTSLASGTARQKLTVKWGEVNPSPVTVSTPTRRQWDSTWSVPPPDNVGPGEPHCHRPRPWP